ncbi:MAG: hypothetical protein IMW89_17980, partial [Ktedonobacteraceae bacterium]|nr:hypothetical protein [Ktedonobacteraceae bacterium]
AVSWDLVALDLVRFDVLSLPPASCLIVFSPFLMRDQTIPGQRRIGQLCAVVGAALLLLPTLWSSFSEDNLQPTILLAGEALALFLLGILIRMRVFILSGAALVIISAMHALFLPSLGIPTPVALVILGGTLLAVATGLSLARRRLQDVWSHWQ